jgi:hypothetical protein
LALFRRTPAPAPAYPTVRPPGRLDREFYQRLLTSSGFRPTPDNVRALVDRVRGVVSGGYGLHFLHQVGDHSGRAEFGQLFLHPRAEDAVARTPVERAARQQALAETGFYSCAPGDPRWESDRFEAAREQLTDDYVLEPERMVQWLWDRNPRFREALAGLPEKVTTMFTAPTGMLRTSGPDLPAWR